MIKFTVFGKCPSKSNCYRIVTIAGRGSLAKSKALKEYEEKFFLQVPDCYRKLNLDDLLKVRLAVYWETMSPDLDNSLKIVFDCLQTVKVIKNDNRIVELHASKHIDKKHPRVEITITKAMPSLF